MAYIDLNKRAPQVEILPDLRLRVTRIYDVLNFVSKTPGDLAAQLELPWGSADVTYTNCLLIKQDVTGQTGLAEEPCKEPPKLTRIYEQIDSSAETAVGNADVTRGQDNLYLITQNYLQFSSGTAIYQTPGTTHAPSPWSAAVLKEEVRTDDGTLRRIKRVYSTTGLVHQIDDTKFNGSLLMRTLISIGSEPATPSNYTLIDKDVNFVNGLPVYTYKYACGSVAAGAGGVISKEVQYGFSPDAGTTGVTWTTIKYISDPSVATNPITAPSSSVEIAITNELQDGFIMWIGKYASGQGVIATEVRFEHGGKLAIQTVTSLNSAPSAPSPVISGTLVLIEKSVRNGSRFEDGTIIYTYRWAETAAGQSSIEKQGNPDGSILFTVTVVDYNGTTAPANPGSGTPAAYCTKLEHIAQEGYYVNRAVWHQLPATTTLKRNYDFEYPGIASFASTQLVLQPPVTQRLMCDHTLTYGSQDTTAEWTIKQPISYYYNYTPTATGQPMSGSEALGRYIGINDHISGTAANFNGVLCDVYDATLVGANPSAVPSGATVLHNDNDIYLTDINGTVVYRNHKVTYTF